MSFTIVDGGVALVVLLSAILAYSRGLTRELLSIVGWVVAAIAAFALAPLLEPLLHEAPVIGEYIRKSCTLSAIAGFVVVFALALIVVSLFTPVFANAVSRSALGSVDSGLGFIYGAARGLLLVAVAYLLYDQLVPSDDQFEIVANSLSHGVVSDAAAAIQSEIPAEMPEWLGSRIDGLMGKCSTTGAETSARGA